jgi:predicted nucleic-acid-binding Zn-ribbon protein
VRLGILVTAAILCITSTAFADKLCLQSTVNKKTLKVTNKSVVAATCPKGYTELADTSRFQGPAGAQGAAGTFSVLSKCTQRENSKTGTGYVNVSVECQSDEFIATNTCDSIDAEVIVTSWLLSPAWGISNKIYSYLDCSGLRTSRFTTLSSEPFTIKAQALCCKGN